MHGATSTGASQRITFNLSKGVAPLTDPLEDPSMVLQQLKNVYRNSTKRKNLVVDIGQLPALSHVGDALRPAQHADQGMSLLFKQTHTSPSLQSSAPQLSGRTVLLYTTCGKTKYQSTSKFPTTLFIKHWNVAGALCNSKGMTEYKYSPVDESCSFLCPLRQRDLPITF